MGLEHLGVVVGDTFDAFVEAHKPVLTGQQFQGPNSTPDPVYILLEDFTHVKFYRLSLRRPSSSRGRFEDGFHHVDDWVPQGSSRRPVRTRCRARYAGPMRSIEYYIILTADGMYADPDGGLDHYDPADDEHRYANELLRDRGRRDHGPEDVRRDVVLGPARRR